MDRAVDERLLGKRRRVFEVKPIKEGKGDEKPLLGSELIDEKYASHLFVARTKSGKTTVLHHLAKYTIDRRSEVYIFCGSVNVDPAWKAIIEMLEGKKCKVHKYNGIKEGKINHLENLMKRFGDEDDRKKKKAERRKLTFRPPDIIKVDHPAEGSDDEDEKAKASRSKYDVPRRVIFIDDVSRNELRDKYVCTAMKKVRHFDCRIFIAGHNVIHMEPDAFEQLFSVHVFKGFSNRYIEMLWERLPSCPIDVKEFQTIYDVATEEPHSFLSIYQWTGQFRFNFRLPALDLKDVFKDVEGAVPEGKKPSPELLRSAVEQRAGDDGEAA